MNPQTDCMVSVFKDIRYFLEKYGSKTYVKVVDMPTNKLSDQLPR